MAEPLEDIAEQIADLIGESEKFHAGEVIEDARGGFFVDIDVDTRDGSTRTVTIRFQEGQ